MIWKPTSLFGRNLLLMIALIVLGQFTSALGFRYLVQRPRIDLAADAAVRTLLAVHDGLAALPPAERLGFAQRFNATSVQTWADPIPSTTPATKLTPLERRFVQRVSQRLVQQGGSLVWQRAGSGALSVRLQIDAQDYWLTLPGLFPAHELPRAWLFTSLGSGLLALGGAWVIQRRINRPLEKLVKAASQLGRGERPGDLPEDGPIEIATVAHSFNEMVANLERNERERAVMLAGISHDLRTPLAKLRLAVELGSSRLDTQLADTMAHSVEAMDAIVGQFLDFARSLHEEPAAMVCLDEVAREAAMLCEVPVEWRLARPPVGRLRPVALRRAIVNLLENAQRHGAPPIELATGHDAERVWLEVRDRGPGISADQSEALKQPFRRGNDSRSGVPGSGLGLSVAERVARLHGGQLDLLPRPGGGLCARMSWPRDHSPPT